MCYCYRKHRDIVKKKITILILPNTSPTWKGSSARVATSLLRAFSVITSPVSTLTSSPSSSSAPCHRCHQHLHSVITVIITKPSFKTCIHSTPKLLFSFSLSHCFQCYLPIISINAAINAFEFLPSGIKCESVFCKHPNKDFLSSNIPFSIFHHSFCLFPMLVKCMNIQRGQFWVLRSNSKYVLKYDHCFCRPT